jgi:hypothetical protein
MHNYIPYKQALVLFLIALSTSYVLFLTMVTLRDIMDGKISYVCYVLNPLKSNGKYMYQML